MDKLASIINDLEQECKRKIEDYLELEDEITALQHAIQVLKGNSPPSDAPLPQAVYTAVAAAVPVPPGPRCSACGSQMFHSTRELKSGKVVNLLVCNDSGCNNETIA